MADVQIPAPGVAAAPLDYVIPGAQEIILKTLFASFDGSAAAAAFYPAIQLIAPGNVLAGTFKTQSTVAAGGSADVTFGPFLEDEPAAAAAAATQPWATLTYNSVVVNTSPTGVRTNPNLDPSLATVNGDTDGSGVLTLGVVFGATHGILIQEEGQYFTFVYAQSNGIVAAPAANTLVSISSGFDTGDLLAGAYDATWVLRAASGLYFYACAKLELFNLNDSYSVPNGATIGITQNSGANLTFGGVFSVYRPATTFSNAFI